MDCLKDDIEPTDDLFPDVDFDFPKSGVIIEDATNEQAQYLSAIKDIKDRVNELNSQVLDLKLGLLKSWKDGVKKITCDFGSATIKSGKNRPVITIRYRKEVD